jgi:hypothetical protein
MQDFSSQGTGNPTSFLVLDDCPAILVTITHLGGSITQEFFVFLFVQQYFIKYLQKIMDL